MKPFCLLTLAAACLLGALTSCAGTSGLNTDSAATQLTVQYATAKLITQSDRVTSDRVLLHVERVRELVDGDMELTTADLVAQVIAGIDTDRLDDADRLLLMALIGQVADSLGELNLISEEHRLTLLTLLDWIEQAARLTGEA